MVPQTYRHRFGGGPGMALVRSVDDQRDMSRTRLLGLLVGRVLRGLVRLVMTDWVSPSHREDR
jgi:hypothetical protein